MAVMVPSRSASAPWHLSHPRCAHLSEAGSAVGLQRIDDFNAAAQNGIGPYPLNVADGVRQNTGIVYLTDEVAAVRI